MSRQLISNSFQDVRSVEIDRECVEHGRHLGAATIAYAAKQQGATVQWITARDVWATLNGRRVAINGHHGTESALSSGIERDKVLAKELMAAAGVTVPAGRRVSSAEDAVQAQHEIGRPIVLKPVNGIMGDGVTVNVINPEDIRAGFSRAARSGASVLVEQYIDVVAEYRAHASSTACEGVFRRLLPSITGDGQSTVTELIEEKNEMRHHNPSTRPFPIPIDDVAEGFLRRRGFTWGSVVPEGRHILVRDVNGITSGGESEECWGSVNDSIKQTAVSAVAAIPGMDWAGVDIVVENESEIPYVIEVNTNAAINGSTFPVYGTPRDLGRVLWNQMYARTSPQPTQTPQTLNLLETPQPLSTFSQASGVRSVNLRDLLAHELEKQGRRIVHHNRRIWSAESPGEPSLWFNAVLSESDLATAISPIRRPFLLWRIMGTVGLRRHAGRRFRSLDQIELFRKRVGTAVALIPLRKNLGRATAKLVESDDHIDESILVGRRNWFVQTRHPGLRFSVIAAPHAALAVIASPEQSQPDDEIVEKVSTLAVAAVRTVPQLRWAVVDIVQPFGKRENDSRPEAVVEEISINPTFDSMSEVIAGSMDKIVDLLITGAHPTAAENTEASTSNLRTD